MPDSPKWLYANGRYDEAREILYGMQVKNGIEVDDRVKFKFKEEVEDNNKPERHEEIKNQDEEAVMLLQDNSA